MRHEKMPACGRWYREMKIGEIYHPALAWGRWIVFFCLLILGIAAITGFIPSSLEQIAIAFLMSGVIFGGIIAIYGGFKSFHGEAYPYLAALFLIPVIIVSLWYLLR